MIQAFSYSYSIPYIIYALFLIVLSWNELNGKINSTIVRKFCIITFVIFFGFRGFISWDWRDYYPIFESIESIDNILYNQGWIVMGNKINIELIEPGYVLYVSIIKSIWNNWHFFIFVSTIIDIIIYDNFIRRFSPIYAFSILIFCVFNLVFEMDLLRNAKALVVFFLSLNAVYGRKWGQLILWTLLGLSFHRSYLIFVVFYIVGLRNFGIKIWWSIFFLVNVIYLFQIPVVSSLILPLISIIGGDYAGKVESYLASDVYSAARGFSLGYIIRVVTFILIVCNYNKILSLNKQLVLILNVYLLYVITNIGMTDISVFCTRMELSLSFSMWILYPILATLYHKKKRILFLGYIFIYSLLRIILSTDNAMLYYENILTGASDYETRMATYGSVSHIIAGEK